MLRLMGLPAANAEARMVSTTELAYIVEESSEGGLLEPSEQIYLENVIDFNQRTVNQVMTPRTRMASLSVGADRMATLALICEERHSRYPVYEEDRDHILGILHVKDVARYLLNVGNTNADNLNTDTGWDLRLLVHPAVFVPESISLDEMLGQFRAQHFQIAIVVDEYGGTSGIVTLEDLAEEIVGEIQDEFDEEQPPFVALDDHTLRVRGDLLLDELTQHYDLDFETEEAEDSETVGGLIMSVLGHVAQPGEEAIVQGVRFVVEAIDGLAISTAMVYLPENRLDTKTSPVSDTPETPAQTTGDAGDSSAGDSSVDDE
jgi:CBS domain containing-hemolysin-like protein